MKYLGIFLSLALAFSFSTSFAGNPDEHSKLSIDREAVRKAIAKHLKDFNFCYTELLKTDAGAAGKIVLSIEINDQGKAQSSLVNLKKSRWQSNAGRGNEGPSLEKMSKCMSEKMLLVEFPTSPQSAIAVVEFPFVFGPR